MKPTKEYVGAILDVCGCFHKKKYKDRKKRYETFKIQAHTSKQKKILEAVMPILRGERVDMRSYILKTHILYQTSHKNSLKNLKRFMKKYCMER